MLDVDCCCVGDRIVFVVVVAIFVGVAVVFVVCSGIEMGMLEEARGGSGSGCSIA